MLDIPLQPSIYESFMNQGVVKTSTLDIHFEIGGNPEAPTIILIMGFGAQMLFWPGYFCKALIDAGFQVIRFDNRDIGLSGKTKGRATRKSLPLLIARSALGLPTSGALYTLEDMAEDTLSLMNALGIDKAHILGASMGGMIAQIFAAKHPDRTLSLNTLFSSNNRAFRQPPFPKQLKLLLTKPSATDEDSIVRHSIQLMRTIGTPTQINSADAEVLARTLYRRSYRPDGAIKHFQAIMATGSLVAYNKKIRTPTMIVHGTHDRLLPPSNSKHIAKAIYGSKLKFIPGMGHDIPESYTSTLVNIFTQHMQLAHTKNKGHS